MDTITERLAAKNVYHPSFLVGAASFLMLFIGIGLKVNNIETGNEVLIASIALGAIHWVWSIIDVSHLSRANDDSRIFWLIVVMLIPPIGGMLFYLMKRKNVQM
jgi:hypothetical protein